MKKTGKQRLFEVMSKLNPEFSGKKFLKESMINDETQVIHGVDNFKKLMLDNPNVKFEFSPDDDKFYIISDITNDGIIDDKGRLHKWYYISRAGMRGDRKVIIAYGKDGMLYLEPNVPNDNKNYWETKADMEDLEADLDDTDGDVNTLH